MIESVVLGNESNVTLDQPMRDAKGRLETYRVRVIERMLSAEARVYSCSYGPELPTLFSELASSWRGWKGEKLWSALEGELSFAASCDSWGHITIEVILRSSSGPDAWRAVTYVHLDAGQLDSVHRELVNFFADEP